ncbi:MAG TPA: hypothetical protein VHE14_06190 [Solirubrobacteraceae bacterium]|nr:hypothetical protein [Solirubrobacteraceae bacterium]
MAINRARTVRGALAGALAASGWAAQQPLDKRAFRSSYDDLEFLGKAVTRSEGWLPAGVALHLFNGAVFGAVYANAAPKVPLPRWACGPLAALTEHVGLWPLTTVSDRLHPARDQLEPLAGNRAAFWQGAWRHLLFGALLGEIERRLNPEPIEPEVSYDAVVTVNGHGSLEHALSAEHPS